MIDKIKVGDEIHQIKDTSINNEVRNIKQKDIENWNNKSTFEGNYNELDSKPSINDVELTGNKTLDDLNIQIKGEYALKTDIPTKINDLENDSGFATETYVENAINNAKLNTDFSSIYKGKKLSILGDSISTFKGYIPSANANYYTGSNAGVTTVEDTWWKKLINALEMKLEVNNSWSGSRVTTTQDGTSAGCMARCENLGSPDVIIVYLGINDFNNEVELGTYNGSGSLPTTTATFRDAYAVMLNKILTKYPTCEVWVCTLPYCERNSRVGFPEINENGVSLKEYNDAIRELADLFNVKVLEHAKCGLTYQNMDKYMGDFASTNGLGLHPNALGHSLMANNDISQLDNTVRIRYTTIEIQPEEPEPEEPEPEEPETEEDQAKKEAMLYNWNFTQSLTDTLQNKTATLGGGTTQSENGLYFSNGTDYADCGSDVMGRNRTIEIDFGNMDAQFDGVKGIFFWVTNPEKHGFGWESTSNTFGGFWNSSWLVFSGVSDKNYFANSTLKITIDESGMTNFYKDDGTAITTINKSGAGAEDRVTYQATDTYLRLGSNNSSFPAFKNMYIKAVRVYNGVF